MGSEMCIRDRFVCRASGHQLGQSTVARAGLLGRQHPVDALFAICLLYTSDAADERSSVDLGGRRIIKKKKSSLALIPHIDHQLVLH